MKLTSSNPTQLKTIIRETYINPDISRYTPRDMEAITGEEYPSNDFQIEMDGKTKMVPNKRYHIEVMEYEMRFKAVLRFAEAKAIQDLLSKIQQA